MEFEQEVTVSWEQEWACCATACLLTLGAHAQRGLQYLVCMSVCVCLCVRSYSATTGYKAAKAISAALVLRKHGY